jgi:hypothetical protein
MMIVVNGGNDAGGIVIVNGRVKRIPGWNPEELKELGQAVRTLSETTRLKTPGLAESMIGELSTFVTKEVARHVSGADKNADLVVVVVGS